MNVWEQLNRIWKKLDLLEARTFPIYDKGSWTPAFAGSTTAGTFTYTANGQVGRWTRTGNIVHIRGAVEISAISVAPVGSMRITGLPSSAVSVSELYGGVAFVLISNIIYPASKLELTGYIGPGNNYISLATSQSNAAGANYPAASFTNVNTRLIFFGEYQVA